MDRLLCVYVEIGLSLDTHVIVVFLIAGVLICVTNI